MSETNLGSVCFFLRGQFRRQNMAESAMDLFDWLRRSKARRGVVRLDAAPSRNQPDTQKKAQRLLLKVSFC